MKSLITLLFSFFLCALLPAQKQLQHEDFDRWRAIAESQISNDGNWAIYTLKPGQGDPVLEIYDVAQEKRHTFDRAEAAKISADNRFVVFQIKPALDTVKARRRNKVKKEELPTDTLAILNLSAGQLTKIPDLESYKMPEKWSGWIAFQLKKMEDAGKTDAKKKGKKASSKNGYPLVVYNLQTSETDTLPFVKTYLFAEEGKKLLLSSTGKDSTFEAGVYLQDLNSKQSTPLFQKKGDYKQLCLDKSGMQASFIADLDTTKARIRPFELYYWKQGQSQAELAADGQADFLPPDWQISEHANPKFSADGSKLFFGVAPQPILEDTSLLDEEIVKVEIWHYEDARLHTQQKVQLSREKKRSYQTVLHLDSKQFVRLGARQVPDVSYGDEGNADFALGQHEESYAKTISWEATRYRDAYLIDQKTGTSKLIGKKLSGNVEFSPAAKYTYWYSAADSAWMCYDLGEGKTRPLTDADISIFYDELNDRPMHPSSYRIAGWLKEDQAVLIYDRYDLWQIDPKGKAAPKRLTDGRGRQVVYRYIQLDREERSIAPDQNLFLYTFDERTKGSGYAQLNLKTGAVKQLLSDPDHVFSSRPLKAKEADVFLTTKQNFHTFPDLYLTNGSMKELKRLSDANPQQADYDWGKSELFEWTSLDGQKLQGIVVKPANFNPDKKYPALVYFYERSSSRLNRYNLPRAGSSSINWSFYASRGYVLFIPDIPYRIGYPGESAYNAVVSGVSALIDEGYIDRERIGVQGHSWGGYQIAYLVTKTDLFKCAEAGAPVVNMTSAYGGIRWASGLSRMFQYEQTQSRLGGTLWEKPLRYLENSPLFFADKINTPVLMMHNDKDGAVPWYQGIEFFVALRRLNKPTWLLNYNDEGHGLRKYQNRRDFQIRMQQYFDYYLLDAPIPQWMQRGIPALEKGILQGLETDTRSTGKIEE